jgi:hypothetical protein
MLVPWLPPFPWKIAYGVDTIVTRDVSGFVTSEIPVKSPRELIFLSK